MATGLEGNGEALRAGLRQKEKILRAHRIPVSVRRWAPCGASASVYWDGCYREETPYGGIQCAVPNRLGRIRTAHRKLRAQNRHSPCHSHETQHQELEAANTVARHFV